MTLSDSCPDDLQLWLRLRQGDEEAFALLFEKHLPTLYNYGIKLAPHRSDLVEDAIQELFIDLWRLRGGLTGEVGSVRFYLYRSLRRKICLLSRSGPTHALTGLEEVKYLSQGSHEAELIQSETDAQRMRDLRTLISKLPARQKEALTLRYFDGFSNPEIAEIMGVSEKSVRNFLHKALSGLKAFRMWLAERSRALLFF